MEDAVVALQSAIDELREAQESLSEDLAKQVSELIQNTAAVLDAVRVKIQQES